MAELKDAIALVTEASNVTRMGVTGPEERFAVKQNRVLKALRERGAGKAEARELALKALEEVGGGAEIRAPRGAGQTGTRSESSLEDWWIPAGVVRF